MKRLLCTAFFVGIIHALSAQTADQSVALGRGFLEQQDAAQAQARFEAAVAIAPDHPDANVLLAVTRLVSLANAPAGSALLDRLGFSSAGRNIFNWQSAFERDTEGLPIASEDLSGGEITAFVHEHVVPALRASEANLERITDTDYTLRLTTAETGLEAVTVDFGDVQMLRALLRFAEYFGYSVHSWNVDAQWGIIRNYLTNENASLETALMENPSLLTFASTNDLFAAQTAFVAAADRYLAASAFIRARPLNQVRLFNLDLEMADHELEFRQTLTDLISSLAGPVVLVAETNLTVHLARHFSGEAPPRAFMPAFRGDAVVLGSLPDATFDGLVEGLRPSSVEEFLSQYSNVVTPLTGNLQGAPRQYEIDMPTLPGRAYALEQSMDLRDWIEVMAFRATSDWFTYTDSAVTGTPIRFYRLVDLTDYITVGGRVVDVCSGEPVSGATVTLPTALELSRTTTDGDGRFFLGTRELPGDSWVDVTTLADGYSPSTTKYWPIWDDGEVELGLVPLAIGPPSNDHFANAIVLTGSAPSGAGSTCGATLEPDEPSGGEGSVWWRWTAPVTGTVSVRLNSFNSWPSTTVYVGDNIAALTRVGFSSFEATAAQTYHIRLLTYATPGTFHFTLVNPPTLTLTSPTDQEVFLSPADVPVESTYASLTSPFQQARIYADSRLIGTVTNLPISFVWRDVAPGQYWLEVEAEDADRNTAYDYAFITVLPGNDHFADRTPLTGGEVLVSGNNRAATREPGEPAHAGDFASGSVWWSWTAPDSGLVTVTTIGEGQRSYNASYLGVYTGSELSSLSVVAANAFGTPFGSRATFNALAGTAYQIAVASWEGGPLQLALQSGAPPTVTLTRPTDGEVFMPGEPIIFEASATSSDGTIVNVAFHDQTGVVGSVLAPPYSWSYSPSESGTFFSVSASALDSRGLVGYSEEVYFEVQEPLPPNDHLADAIELFGSSASFSGTNRGATKEPNEPNHAGNSR